MLGAFPTNSNITLVAFILSSLFLQMKEGRMKEERLTSERVSKLPRATQ